MAPGPHSWGVQLIDPRARRMRRRRFRIDWWHVLSAVLMVMSASIVIMIAVAIFAYAGALP